MNTTLAEVILFVASAVSALIAAFRADILPKVEKVALAVCFAATGFVVYFMDKLR